MNEYTPAQLAAIESPAIWRRTLAIAPELQTLKRRRPNPLPGVLAVIVFVAVILWAVAGKVHP